MRLVRKIYPAKYIRETKELSLNYYEKLIIT